MNLAEDLDRMRVLAADPNSYNDILKIARDQKDFLTRGLKDGGTNLFDIFESTEGKVRLPAVNSFNSAFRNYLDNLDVVIDAMERSSDGVVLALSFDSMQAAIDTMRMRLSQADADEIVKKRLRDVGLGSGVLAFALQEIG